jgi:hypothetical protein
MTTATSFDYDRFVTLDGLELCHYVEGLLADPAATISSVSLERMLSELPGYDEYHLVYALTLGAAHSPQTFGPVLPQYLAHEESSVCCTAFNLLSKLPDAAITQDLIESVRKVPERRLFFTKPDTGERVCPGTNSRLVAEILGELTRRLQQPQSQ